MDENYVKKINVNYYFLFGIVMILLGIMLFIINLYGLSWVNLIPLHSAPVIGALVLVLAGILLIISWIKNIRKGIKVVSS